MKEPRWLAPRAVEQFHERSIDLFGGSHGIRDPALIEFALSRPKHRWTYAEGCDLADLAASYAFGLAKNHGYVDGNKRIAFVAMAVFLYLNDLLLEAPDEEAVRVMIEVASGERSEDSLAGWIRARVVPRGRE